MRNLVLLALTVTFLGACSSTPKVQLADQSQYCYTDQKIVNKDNKQISSETTLTCSDKLDLNNSMIVKSGMVPRFQFIPTIMCCLNGTKALSM